MDIYKILRPIIFKIDPEISHNLAINFLKFFPRTIDNFTEEKNYPNLATEIWGIKFKNPIGMSAGFDKNAEIFHILQKFGFGFVEAGTVTPIAQYGNQKPRIFRLIKDKAIINSLGFNNFGSDIFLQNIKRNINKNSIPIGINIGKNKDSEGFDDYIKLLEKFYHYASYITINISSPNTKNLRNFHNQDQLENLLENILEKKIQLKTNSKNIPILLKISPDLKFEEQENIAKIILDKQIDGLIISNTTTSRDQNLVSKNIVENGGLSGAPLLSKSNEVLKNFYQLTKGKVPIIATGGIFSAKDVYDKIQLGASLVQIYTAFIYEGFSLVEKIKKDLNLMLAKEGLHCINNLVGSYHNKKQ